MIPIILLVCVSGVGVVGLVIAVSLVKDGLVARRERRARAAFVEQARARAAVVAPVEPVANLTGVLAKLEESAQFARVDTPVTPARWA